MDMDLWISTIISIVIAIFLIYEYVYKFYSKVKLYPRGPMPLPIIGNCLMLRKNSNQHLCYFLKNLANEFGDAYTFWLATKPIVVIHGIGLAKDAFNRNEFCDRFEPSMESEINKSIIGGHKSFSIMNMCAEYKLLRSLSAQSVRKFLTTDKLSKITHEIITDTVGIIKERENENRFVPFKYIESLFIRLLIESIFGRKLTFDHHLIGHIYRYFERIHASLIGNFVCEFIPLYKYAIDWTKNKKETDNTIRLFRFWYKNHIKTKKLIADSIDSIGEALTSCANDVQSKRINEANDYLNDSNMIATFISLFIAGSDISQYAFKWILLLMCYHPEMQQKMRNEINLNIGNNKIAELSDKEKCVYVNAFICETLRFRNVGPLAIPHLTSVDTKLGDTTIPKGTAIVLNQMSILNDSRYWKNPDIFNPERFIDSDQNLVASKMCAFIPFSTGKRMCIGDKFAMNMLFFALTSLLQATDSMKFVLSDKSSIDIEPMNFGVIILEPKVFQIRLIID